MSGSTCDSYLELLRLLVFLRYQGVTRSAVSELDGSWTSALGSAPFLLSYASVHHGAQHHVGKFLSLVSIQFWVRVDPETVSVSAASEKVAGVNQPVRNLTTSPLLTLFVSVPQSQCSWDGGSSPTMRWVAGVCFSSLCADSCGSVKAPLVLWGPANNHSSLLAPEALVSGVSGAGSRRAFYRWWCTSEGHSIYWPSLSNFADFLFWIRTSNKLSVSSVLGYRSMISAVFRSELRETSTSLVLHALSCGNTC